MAERTDHARSSASSNPVRVRFDRFELDEANARLLRDGTAVALAPTPFAVLCALVRQPGSLLTTNALLDEVWGHQFVTDSVLRTAISELRTALDDDARKPRFIETVSRRGYRFIAAPSAIPAAPSVQPNVSGLATVRAPYFIGRAEPLSRLRRAWDIACSGKRAVVWIAGEPGIGKTTLIEQFIASLGDVACARGQCVEHYGTGEPYLPVLEALEELCRSDSEVPSLLRAVAPTWLLQLPWLSTAEEREALRRELAGVSPDRMLREMGQFLDRYTERRPLLLVTEDLHWSDRATIQLIDYIARRRGSARLMWLASFRLAEVVALDHPLNPLRHELRLHDLCEEIVLDPFSESEVADYVAERSPAIATDEAFVRALHERTDGLPLFVASVMTEVIARAAQAGDDAAAGSQLAKIAVPENLAAIIDHYIAKLTSDQRLVLSAAAVCGIEFRIHTISGALERDAAWVGQTCDELAREQLWLVAPRAEGGSNAAELPYSFRHALFRQVLYERTTPVGAGAAPPENGRRPGTRARHRRADHRRRAGDAFRARRRRNDRRALLRRGRRRRSCPLQPRRVHQDRRTRVAAARAGARWAGAQRAANHDRNASRCRRHPGAWRRAAKRSIRSSERTRCSTKIRSIRSEGACCTDSVSCSPCVPNMPRRSRWPIARKRSDQPRTIRCSFRPRARCMGRSISFRVARRQPAHGSSAG